MLDDGDREHLKPHELHGILWPAHLQHMKNESQDGMTMMALAHCVELQAEKENNFIGNAFYYKLTDAAVS